MRGWKVEAPQTQVGQGLASMWIHLEPGQLNLLKVFSGHIWQVPESQNREGTR